MAMTAAFLRYTALALPFTMLCQAAGAHLIVIGKERISAIVNILEGGAVLAAMSWILGTGLGISGMWAARPAAALAVALINLLIINTCVPVLFAYGRHTSREELCDRAFDFLEQLKAENNHIIRMWQECGLEVRSAGDSQALIQLKKEYCDKKDCLRCRIGYEYLKRNKSSK